jgi:hypothetical protein
MNDLTDIYHMMKSGHTIYLHSASVFVLKAKRQLQKTSTSIGGEVNEDKASGGCHRF